MRTSAAALNIARFGGERKRQLSCMVKHDRNQPALTNIGYRSGPVHVAQLSHIGFLPRITSALTRLRLPLASSRACRSLQPFHKTTPARACRRRLPVGLLTSPCYVNHETRLSPLQRACVCRSPLPVCCSTPAVSLPPLCQCPLQCHGASPQRSAINAWPIHSRPALADSSSPSASICRITTYDSVTTAGLPAPGRQPCRSATP